MQKEWPALGARVAQKQQNFGQLQLYKFKSISDGFFTKMIRKD